jgi:hypothetical protein
MTEPLEPVSICATSSSLTTVDVAAGASIIVLVTVIGVPAPFSPEDGGETVAELDVALPSVVVVELSDVPMMEAVEVCMHPFGEHTSFFGQRPPPAAAGHSTRDAKHFGGWDSEA